MKNLLLVLAAIPFLVLSCDGAEKPAPEPEVTPDAPAGEVPAATVAAEYKAMCGHALPEIGKCGNYIQVDGEWVVLEHPSLGAMEWCKDGEKGATVKVAGAMVDGKFVASTYERVD